MSRSHQRSSGPYFANQRANLNFLSSSLSNFSAELGKDAKTIRSNLTTPLTSDTIDNSNMLSTSNEFLKTQQKRVVAVEEELLDATEFILPIDDGEDSMTVNELSLQCIALQKEYVQEMERLEEKLRNYGFDGCSHKQWYASFAKNPSSIRQNWLPSSPGATPWNNVVGRPLEQVIEAEYETDGTITPASTTAKVFTSPKSALCHSSTSSTPETPSFEKLRLSVNTTSVLKQSVCKPSGGVATLNFTPTQNDEDPLDRELRLSLDAIERWRKQDRRQNHDKSLELSCVSNQSPINKSQTVVGTSFQAHLGDQAAAAATCKANEDIKNVEGNSKVPQSGLPDVLGSDECRQEKQEIEGHRRLSVTDMPCGLASCNPTHQGRQEEQATNANKELFCAEFLESDEEMTLDITHDDGVSLVTTATLVGRGRTRKKQYHSVAADSQEIADAVEEDTEDVCNDVRMEMKKHSGNETSVAPCHLHQKPSSSKNSYRKEQSLNKSMENERHNTFGSSKASLKSMYPSNSHSEEQSMNENCETQSINTVLNPLGRGKLNKTIPLNNRHDKKYLNRTMTDAVNVEAETDAQTKHSTISSISRPMDHHIVGDVYIDEDNTMSPVSMVTANHTVDVTVLDETLPPSSPPKENNVKENDESLTVTPVLDRYRLEADDSSIGVKVVPNPRGTRHNPSTKVSIKPLRVNAAENEHIIFRCHTLDSNTQARSTINISKNTTMEKETYQRAPLASLNVDLNTPNKAEANLGFTKANDLKKEVYRKTPHSKKLGGLLPIDENDSSRLSQQNRVYLEPGPPLSSPPPNLMFSNDQALLPTPMSETKNYNANIVSRTPLTAAWMAEHMPNEKETAGGDTSILPSFTTELHGSFEDHLSAHVEEAGIFIRNLTQEEYDAAPRVVKMQVTLNEVNRAADLLGVGFKDQHRLGCDATKTQEISEVEAYSLLRNEFSERKSRSVLMSLCHWRRMVMVQTIDSSGKSFILNS